MWVNETHIISDIVNSVVFGDILFHKHSIVYSVTHTVAPQDCGEDRDYSLHSGIILWSNWIFYNFFLMRNIFISCGHNNARNWIKDENGKWALWSRDQWAIVKHVQDCTEYRWVNRVAIELFKIMGSDKIYNLKFVPRELNLDDRIAWINKRATDGDVCIELHMNSWGWEWVEVFAHTYSSYALKKAWEFSSILAINLRIKNRWGKSDNLSQHKKWLGFIRNTKPLAFLVEMGFLDNANDRDQVWINGALAIKTAIWAIL